MQGKLNFRVILDSCQNGLRLQKPYGFYDPSDYTETGAGGADLHVHQKNVQSLDLGLGVSVSKSFTLANGGILAPEIHTGVRMAAIGGNPEAMSTFTGGGTSFTSQGQTMPRFRENAGVGLTYAPDADWSVKANYDYEATSGYHANSGYVSVNYQF